MSERSIYCIQQDHGNCNGIIINLNIKHDESKICNCQCHNNMYSLIKKAFLALKIMRMITILGIIYSQIMNLEKKIHEYHINE